MSRLAASRARLLRTDGSPAQAAPGSFGRYDCILFVTDHKAFDDDAMVAEQDRHAAAGDRGR